MISHSSQQSVSQDFKNSEASAGPSQGRPNYTIINHKARIALQISLTEYCVFDLIHHLAAHAKNTKKGWCYAKKETIASYLALNRATVFRAINKGLEHGLLEKHPEQSTLLRATKRWYTAVQISQRSSRRILSPHPSQTATADSRKLRPNKDRNKENNKIAGEPQKTVPSIGTLLSDHQLHDTDPSLITEWQAEARRLWLVLGLVGEPSLQFFKHIKQVYATNQQRKLERVISYCQDAKGIRDKERFFYWRYAHDSLPITS